MPSRERTLMPAFLPTYRAMPAPVGLPNLRDALARRATVFGPVDLDEVTLTQDTPLGRWLALGAAARRAVEAIATRVRA